MDEKRQLCTFNKKRLATEVAADALGEEWKVLWSGAMEAMTDKAFPRSRALDP